MALGSKGNNSNTSNTSSRGRPYGMMLLLAFGAAILGVMVLHKLRERRIFTLLIQDKDQHLMNLHLLLQKERESSKEIKRKFEDLKAKYVTVRTEKQAMKSITTSLKQEQRSLESKLEEKQNEINMLRRKGIHSTSENSQIQALKEILKQKEEEIQEMKHLLEKPTTVWSVSTDDPSNSPVLPVVSDKATGSFGDSRNVTDGSEPNSIYGEQMQKLDKAQNDEDLEQMANAGEKNIEKSVSSVPGDEKLMMDNKNKTEVTIFTSHRDDTDGEGGGTMAMDGNENVMKLQVPEGDEGQLRNKMFKHKDGRKLKRLNRSGMIVGTNRGGRLDRNDRVQDLDYGLRTEDAGINTLPVDHISSEVYGKRNPKILEHSKDDGFRRSSDMNDRVHLKETDQRADLKEGNSYPKHDIIGGQKGEERQQLGTVREFVSNERELENQRNAESREGSSEFSSSGSGTQGHQAGSETNDTEKEAIEEFIQHRLKWYL